MNHKTSQAENFSPEINSGVEIAENVAENRNDGDLAVDKARRPRRSKIDIENAILNSALLQIRQRGFALSLVTDLVKAAKIEPVVFYNRYKNLQEFYDTLVKDYDFWLHDITLELAAGCSSSDGLCKILENLFNRLNDSKDLMSEILRWEIAESCPTTLRSAHLRHLHAVELCHNIQSNIPDKNKDVTAIMAIIVGGMYYMHLHKDRSPIADIDINTPAGKHRIFRAIRSIISQLYDENTEEEKIDSNDREALEAYRQKIETKYRQQIQSEYREHVEDLLYARREQDRNRIIRNLRKAGVSEEVILSCVPD